MPIAGPMRSKWWSSRTDYFGNSSKVEGTTDNSFAITPYLSGLQITESENHPGFKHRKRGVWTGDVGGNFTSYKKWSSGIGEVQLEHSYREGDPRFGDTIGAFYKGPWSPIAPIFMEYPTAGFSSEGELASLGNKAIGRCAPSNPTADLTVMIGEIVKDGIPHLIGNAFKSWTKQSSKQRRKSIAEEHLNYEFGWKPLMSDLRKLSKALLHAEDIIAQYDRDSGKVVRRRYEFPDHESTSSRILREKTRPWMNPSGSGFDLDRNAVVDNKVILVTTIRRKQWFSGGFSYYIPPRGSTGKAGVARDVILAKKLLGLSLTPDTIWNLSPWSWAIDWFSNIGTSLENWSNWAIDGQVLLYGYVMEHVIASNTYTWVGPTGFVGKSTPPTVTLSVERKVRRRASPYGFGIAWEQLSPRQIAIATSLGVTHKK
jgi:hypothetical protein